MGLIMTYGFYKVGKGIREQKCVPFEPPVSSANPLGIPDEGSRFSAGALREGDAYEGMIAVNSRAKRCGGVYI